MRGRQGQGRVRAGSTVDAQGGMQPPSLGPDPLRPLDSPPCTHEGPWPTGPWSTRGCPCLVPRTAPLPPGPPEPCGGWGTRKVLETACLPCPWPGPLGLSAGRRLLPDGMGLPLPARGPALQLHCLCLPRAPQNGRPTVRHFVAEACGSLVGEKVGRPLASGLAWVAGTEPAPAPTPARPWLSLCRAWHQAVAWQGWARSPGPSPSPGHPETALAGRQSSHD